MADLHFEDCLSHYELMLMSTLSWAECDKRFGLGESSTFTPPPGLRCEPAPWSQGPGDEPWFIELPTLGAANNPESPCLARIATQASVHMDEAPAERAAHAWPRGWPPVLDTKTGSQCTTPTTANEDDALSALPIDLAQPSMEQAFSNLGSLGHPALCSRPCLYFWAGHCENGDDCAFCHETHSVRPSHLDKSKREKLAAMSTDLRTVWLFALVSDQVLKLVGSAVAQAYLDELAAACGISRSTLPDRKSLSRRNRVLWEAVAALRLRELLTMLRKSTCDDARAVAAIDALVHKCQSALQG